MALVHAGGISVRHAIARALATNNRSPWDATWRLVHARAEVDTRGRLSRAEASVDLVEPGDPRRIGVVNPDGLHPMMAAVPGMPGVLLDVIPVTWDRWVRIRPGPLPASLDPWCARTGVELADARAWAALANKRLPTVQELRAVWGKDRYPWGHEADARRGHAEPPRFGEVHEVALHPPTDAAFFDLGAWLWQWTAEGDLVGGAPALVPGGADATPVGFRCAVDL